MRTLRQTVSAILILAMALPLTSFSARAMYVVVDGGSVSVSADEGSRGLVASFDEDGRLSCVGDGLSLSDGQTLKVMQLDEKSAAPQTGAMALTKRAGATYEDLFVPKDAALEAHGDAALTGRAVVDGTLAIPEGAAVIIEPGAELLIDDVTEGACGKIALGGTIYAYGWLNIGDWNRRVVGWDAEAFGKVYAAIDLFEPANVLGERFDGSDAVSRNGGWRANAAGKKLLSRLLHEDGLSFASLDALNEAYRNDPDNWALRNAHNRVEGFDILHGCGALELDALTEENNYDPPVTAETLRSVWTSAVGEAAPEPELRGVWEDEEYPGATLFAAERCDGEDGYWKSSFRDAVEDYINRLGALFLASAEHLTLRADGSGVYAEADGGTRCYNAVEGVTFPQRLRVTADGSMGGQQFAFDGCVFAGGADFTLENVRNADVVINGVRVGFDVNFRDSCTGVIAAHTDELGELGLCGLGGMTVAADSGVSLDATEAEDGTELRIGRRFACVHANDWDLNDVFVADWGEYVIQPRMRGNVLTAEDVVLTLDGAPLPFAAEERYEGDEYVFVLRREPGSAWFDGDSCDKLSLTVPLCGAALTLAPPPPEWMRAARNGELADMLLDILSGWDCREPGDSLCSQFENDGSRDAYVTCAAANAILTGVWRELTDGGAAPPDFRADGRAENDVLTRGEVSELIHGRLQYSTFLGEFSGGSAAELQALLDSGRRTAELNGAVTLDGDVAVTEDTELVVREGAALTIPEPHALTVRGTMVNIGAVTGAGTLTIAEEGVYINETDNRMTEGQVGVAKIDNRGVVIYFVTEKPDGKMTRQAIFSDVPGNVDCRAVVSTQVGFDNSVKESYNRIILINKGVLYAAAN